MKNCMCFVKINQQKAINKDDVALSLKDGIVRLSQTVSIKTIFEDDQKLTQKQLTTKMRIKSS